MSIGKNISHQLIFLKLMISSYQSFFVINSLLENNLESQKNLFNDLNQLVDKLHKLKLLLEKDQSQEALLIVDQLVPYSESIIRKV